MFISPLKLDTFTRRSFGIDSFVQASLEELHCWQRCVGVSVFSPRGCCLLSRNSLRSSWYKRAKSVAAANKLARLCKVILITLKNVKCCTRCSTLIWLLSLRAAEHVVRCVLLLDLCTSSCCSFLSHTGWPRFLLNNSSEEFRNIFLPQETFWKRV